MPLGPCSGFKAKRRDFTYLFFFLFCLLFFFFFGRHIGLHSWGTITYYGLSTTLRLVLQSKWNMQLLSLMMKTDVHCVCGKRMVEDRGQKQQGFN